MIYCIFDGTSLRCLGDSSLGVKIRKKDRGRTKRHFDYRLCLKWHNTVYNLPIRTAVISANIAIITTSSSAIEERQRCKVGYFWPKVED